MIDMNEKTHLIRKRETLESIDREEKIPEYLQSFKL
jgi:hypothetical protein